MTRRPTISFVSAPESFNRPSFNICADMLRKNCKWCYYLLESILRFQICQKGRETALTIKLEAGLDLSPFNPLRIEIANLLRRLILNGQIPPGERLIETEIAEQLGVSRMPVREALRILESEGLIRQVPHKGLFVTQLSEDDIREFYTIRQALEVCAIKIVTDRITRAEIEALRGYCEKAREAFCKNDIDGVCFWTAKFNEEIYVSCGMPRFEEEIKNTQNYLRTFRFLSFRTKERAEQALSEHEEIIRLVEAKDHEGAARATEKHLKRAMESYIEAWKERGEKNNSGRAS